MAKRGIPCNAPDFQYESLRGAASDVGFLGVQPAISLETGVVVAAFIVALILGDALGRLQIFVCN